MAGPGRFPIGCGAAPIPPLPSMGPRCYGAELRPTTPPHSDEAAMAASVGSERVYRVFMGSYRVSMGSSGV